MIGLRGHGASLDTPCGSSTGLGSDSAHPDHLLSAPRVGNADQAKWLRSTMKFDIYIYTYMSIFLL